MKFQKILILIDYRNSFYSSTRERGGSFDLAKLKNELDHLGYEVTIQNYRNISFLDSYEGTAVLYQSTEDPGLYYKSYITDLLLSVKERGGYLVPGFSAFRAHHNKAYMEILRKTLFENDFFSTRTEIFGSVEDFEKRIGEIEFPVVLKTSEGSRGRGVFKALSKKKALRLSRKIARTFNFQNICFFFSSLIKNCKYKYHSNYRKKFIVQKFLPSLEGDYKVLIYGQKYYVLKRKNRPDDFRASGSGRLEFPQEPPKEVLSFARDCFLKADVPFASFDIAHAGSETYLLEFQFISFGQHALEKSNFFFEFKNNEWQKVEGITSLEREFSAAIHEYLQNKNKL